MNITLSCTPHIHEGIPTIEMPPSKSIRARMLLLQAVATPVDVPLQPFSAADCRDIRALSHALNEIRRSIGEANPVVVNVDESGTALRFCTAYASALSGSNVVITGSGRIPSRPMAPLVETLTSMGAAIGYLDVFGHAPLEVKGRKLHWCISDRLFTSSSQYASAIILIAPLIANAPAHISLPDDMPSRPYAVMSQIMAASPHLYNDRGDWSAAAFFYELAALSRRPLMLEGITIGDDLQGDSHASTLFSSLGVDTIVKSSRHILLAPRPIALPPRINCEMSQWPDLIPPFLLTAALCGADVSIAGCRSLRDKESDRVASLMQGLYQLGVDCQYSEAGNGTIRAIRTRPILKNPIISSCADHRIAMAFAAACPAIPEAQSITITEAECVDKSYPLFWHDMKKIYSSI